MKVLVVGRSYPEKSTGMIGVFEFGQSKLLNTSNIHTSYLFLDHRSIKHHTKIKKMKDKVDGVNVYGSYIPIGGLHHSLKDLIDYFVFKRLYSEYENENGKPDIVHIHFPLITINIKIIKFLKKENIKIIVTEHWSKILKKSLNHYELKNLESIYYLSDKFLSVSNTLKDSIDNLLSVEDSKIIVVPNFVKESFFNVNKINSMDNKFHYYVIGRLIESKNISMILTSFSNIIDSEFASELHIIGDGPYKEDLEILAKRLGIKDSIIFHGFKLENEVPSLIGRLHVYISASKVETFGVPIVESMAIGNQVIVPLGSPLDDIVKENSGLLYNVESFDDLSSKMIIARDIFMKSDFNSEQISENTKMLFSEESIRNQLLKIYNTH